MASASKPRPAHRYPAEIFPKELYLGDWKHAEVAVALRPPSGEPTPPKHTRHHRVIHDTTESCTTPPSHTRHHRVIHDTTEPYTGFFSSESIASTPEAGWKRSRLPHTVECRAGEDRGRSEDVTCRKACKAPQFVQGPAWRCTCKARHGVETYADAG